MRPRFDPNWLDFHGKAADFWRFQKCPKKKTLRRLERFKSRGSCNCIRTKGRKNRWVIGRQPKGTPTGYPTGIPVGSPIGEDRIGLDRKHPLTPLPGGTARERPLTCLTLCEPPGPTWFGRNDPSGMVTLRAFAANSCITTSSPPASLQASESSTGDTVTIPVAVDSVLGE